jgi:membrane associated rhomboid family serine protease
MFFIPIGFGARPKIMPWGMLLLALTSITWTYLFLPIFNKSNETFQQQKNEFDLTWSNKYLYALKVACDIELSQANKVEKKFCTRILNHRHQLKKHKDLKLKIQTLIKLELSSVGESYTENQKTIFRFLIGYQIHPSKWPLKIREHKSVKDFLAYEKKFLQNLAKKHYSAFNLFTKTNKTLFAITQASFTHSGAVHLLVNLFLLLILGVWIEQSIGALRMLGIFVASSFLGLWSQITFTDTSAVLGASAGIMGLAGCFFSLFHKKELTLIATVIIYSKKIYVPTLWIFPALYLCNDLISILAAAGGTTAFLAHFIGMVSGLIFGWICKHQMKITDDAIYKFEANLQNELKEQHSFPQEWIKIKKILDINPQNWLIYERIFNAKDEEFLEMTVEENKWLLAKVDYYFKYKLKRYPINEALITIKKISKKFCLNYFFKDIPTNQILFLADRAISNRDLETALSLFKIGLEKNPSIKTIEKILSNIKNLEYMIYGPQLSVEKTVA